MQEIDGDAATLVAFITKGLNHDNVVVGPLVDGVVGDGDRSYFIVAVSVEGKGFVCDQVIVNSETERMMFLLRLAEHRPPLIIHALNDEVVMVRLCEALWPSKRISRLRRWVEAEADRRQGTVH